MKQRDEEWNGPIDHPNHLYELDDSKSAGCCDDCRCPSDCDQPGPHCKIIKDGKPNHSSHSVSKDNLIEEVTERIVIEYANLSGRESDNRSPFRNSVRVIIVEFYSKAVAAGREERENEINPDHLYMEGLQKGAQEERAFILNVLDGIDIADREAGLTQSTKAIRFALQSRSI